MIPLHSHQLWQAIVDSTITTGEGRALLPGMFPHTRNVFYGNRGFYSTNRITMTRRDG